ncbi:MAG: LysM peptidoglycan-binding domain-containing protein [Candidatus Sumerlaeia bacterium]|nr:LysM peptidoglycan-binding domain-containing protein [Candidatus Sumerlaeia bacterium]
MGKGMSTLIHWVWAGVVMAALIGCGPDVRKDPFIADKFTQIDNALAKTKDLPTRMQELNDELTALKSSMKALRADALSASTPIALANRVNQIDQRVSAIEGRLAALEGAIKALGKGAAAVPAAPTKVAATPAAPAPAAPTKAAAPVPAPKATPIALKTGAPAAPTSPVKTAAKAPSSAAKATGTGRAGQAVTPKTTAGYYIVVEGDTLQSIARKRGVTVEAILRANTFLRSDTTLMPGQQLWIPAK